MDHNPTVTFHGSLHPDHHPVKQEPVQMNYNFSGYAIVFLNKMGMFHIDYLKCNLKRALSYAINESKNISTNANVWEVHSIPKSKNNNWKIVDLPQSTIDDEDYTEQEKMIIDKWSMTIH
jgi:hypothetical protein